jgi:hypothetical protein
VTTLADLRRGQAVGFGGKLTLSPRGKLADQIDESSDALGLGRAVLHVEMGEALAWSRRWLGLEDGNVTSTRRSTPRPPEPEPSPDRWRHPWQAAKPIAGTLTETYFAGRKLHFEHPAGRVLRFASGRWRRNTKGQHEFHPALLCALSDARTDQQCGTEALLQDRSGRAR